MAKTKGIYKRGNIYWIRYAGFDGKIIRESAGTNKYREAEALLIQRKQAVREGKLPEVKNIPNCNFHELVEKYVAWMDGRHKSADTKKYRINSMIEYFGNIPLRHFDTLKVEQYQTSLLNRGLKSASVNKNVSILKAMIHKAVDWSLVEEDVLKKVRRVKQLQENNRRLRYLSKEECQELVNNSEPHLKPIILTALNTGMRKGEILNLKWDNIDLRHGFILLNNTKNGERREIPINDTLRTTLQGLTRRIDVQFVFHVPKTGKQYLDVKRSFTTACRRSGINDFHFHDLRHTFASHLVMSGVDLTTVKELLGHKTLSMTVRYAHLAPSHKVKAVNVLDNYINEKSTAQKLHNLKR